MGTFYVPRPPIDDPWQGRSDFPPNLLPAGGGFPFKPPYWKYNNDDYPVWLRKSVPVAPILLPAGGGYPFKPPYWKFHYDDAAFWLRQSRPLTTASMPEMGGIPFKPPYWKWNNDDPGYWIGAKTTPVFQPVFPIIYGITSTHELQLPVNCVMMGDQVYDRMDFHEGVPPGHEGLRPAKGLWGKKS